MDKANQMAFVASSPTCFFSRIVFCLMIALLALFVTTPIEAAPTSKVASTQDVALAFYKLAGITPDFEAWVRSSNKFKRINKGQEAVFVAEETEKLKAMWNSYDPEKTFLTIKTRVQVELLEEKVNGKPVYQMKILLRGGATYFPYTFNKENFALIPQKIDALLVHPIDEVQYRFLLKELGGGEEKRALLSVMLKPVKAYTNQPYKIDNLDQWALLSDIAGLFLVSDKDVALWDYNAPWYVSPVTEQLNGLYVDRISDSADKKESPLPVSP